MKITSQPLTILDTTDSRKLEIYISSNLPNSQIYNSNMGTYTPDWSVTNLILSADVYLDSTDITSKATIVWYKQGINDATETELESTTISNNVLTNTNMVMTYICRAEYQGLTAFSKITFSRVDTGKNGSDGTSAPEVQAQYSINGSTGWTAELNAATHKYIRYSYDGGKTWTTAIKIVGEDGTSVSIKGTATSKTAVSGTSYYTLIYEGTTITGATLGDAYLLDGNMYVCVDSRDGNDYFMDVGRIQGPQGNDGQSSYVFIRYATDASGSNMSSTPNSSTTHIGICTVNTNNAPITPISYTWSKFVGDSPKSIILHGSSQIFKVIEGVTTQYSPTTITVTAQTVNIDIQTWEYSVNGGTSWVTITTTNPIAGVAFNAQNKTMTITGERLDSNSIIIRASNGDYGDTYSVYKVFDGHDGDTGQPASMTFLTNENISFAANANGQVATTAFTTNVVAYTGTTKVAPTIGAIGNLPSGMTVIPNKGTAYSSVIPTIGNLTVADLYTSNTLTTKIDKTTLINGDSFVVGDYLYIYNSTNSNFKCKTIVNTEGVEQPSIFVVNNEIMLTFSIANNATLGSNASNNGTITIPVTSPVSTNLKLSWSKINTGATGTPGTAGEDAYTVLLTNESHTFAGEVSNAVNGGVAETQVLAYKGATKQSVTISTVNGKAAGIVDTGTGITGLKFKCSAISGTDIKITFTCTNAFVSQSGTIPVVLTVGGITFTKMFTYAIAFKGNTGGTGATGNPGSPATAYWLVSSASVVQKASTGTIALTPSTLIFTGKSKTGTSAPIDYGCRWKIATSTDGINFTDSYTSSIDETSKSFGVELTYRAVRVRMYLSGGTATLLDEQIIPVVTDGTVGASGSDAVTFQVYSVNGYALSKNIPNITLQTFAYVGSAEITENATYKWYSYGDIGWEEISGASNSSLIITRENVSFSKSYMCKMTFNGVEYTDVATVDDKSDDNKVFTTQPSNYTAGDLWIVGVDYKPANIEVGTLLRAAYTNKEYADSDWITATKYDEKINELQNSLATYNQYFSFDSSDGLKISARDENGVASKFSTSLTNERLSFNYGNESIAYINGTKMNIKEAEIESPLTITGKYSGSTMLQAPVINIGNFSIVVESNGSLSIVANT